MDTRGSFIRWLLLQSAFWVIVLPMLAVAQSDDFTAPPREENSPRLLWNRHYGKSLDDAAYSARPLPDGRIVMAGDCIVDTSGLRKMCLLLVSSYGDTLWERSFEGDQTASCRAVRLTNDGGFVLCGSTRGVGSRGIDHYVVKTDAHGIEEWSRISQERGADYAESILHARGGGFISAGRKVSGIQDESDGAFHLVKTNKPGKIVWTRNYDGEQANSVIEVDEGFLVAAGYTKIIPQGARPAKPPEPEKMPWEASEAETDTSLCLEEAAFYVVKVNWKGEFAWSRTYWSSGWDVAYSISMTEDKGLLIAGTVGGCRDKPENNDCWVIRTDVNGDTLWTHRFGGEFEDVPQAVIESSDGGILVAGYTYSWGAGQADMLVYKLSARGELLWTKTIGGTQDEFAHDIQQAPDGGYIVAGSTESFGEGGSDMYLCKLMGK